MTILEEQQTLLATDKQELNGSPMMCLEGIKLLVMHKIRTLSIGFLKIYKLLQKWAMIIDSDPLPSKK